ANDIAESPRASDELKARAKAVYDEVFKPEGEPAAPAAPRPEEDEAVRAWREKRTESPYFKKWFGDSKVVDDEGKPLVVYHGTDKDFEAFEPRTRKGEQMAFGTHFSEGQEIANRYAD